MTTVLWSRASRRLTSASYTARLCEGVGPGPARPGEAMREKDFGIWQEITWSQYRQAVLTPPRSSRSRGMRATGFRSILRTVPSGDPRHGHGRSGPSPSASTQPTPPPRSSIPL